MCMLLAPAVHVAASRARESPGAAERAVQRKPAAETKSGGVAFHFFVLGSYRWPKESETTGVARFDKGM
jgi:hypothetical protein